MDLLARALALSVDEAGAFARAAQHGRARHGDGEPAAGPHAGSLPVALTSFVGRGRELGEVARRLGASRLVTLTGAGGCGKTRLALAAAEAARPGFPVGVRFVDLAPLTEAAAIAPAVLAAVGAPRGAGSPEAALLAYLHDRAVLLLLDNCEHPLDACARLVEAVLRGCPGVRILATSREPLGVEGEAVYRVPSLGLPDPARPLDAATAAEAVRLFASRAALVQPDFAVDARNAAAVVAICQRLDGIPLALELAAARTRVLPPEQLLARLDDRFRLLVGGRTALRRQQTLRAAIDWSYALLAEPERRLFRRLAVFAGGFTLEAAEAVGGGDDLPTEEVLDVLTALVDQSLVQVDAGGAVARYRLPETLRQYAEEVLLAASEAAMARDRHVRYFVTLAERERIPLARSVLDNEASLWAAREGANLAAAIDWAGRRVSDDGAAALPADAALRLFVGLPDDALVPYGDALARLRQLLGMGDGLTYHGPVTLEEI